ncbi:MAG: glycine--tRNA ligase subunit beta [bacterium]|nr:glycine--tRNA ligase subunit beta [bacterium]
MSTSQMPARLPFLLEIGSEEIPARFVPDAMVELERRLAEGLAAAHLQAEGIRVVATPRRLALLIEALDTRQPDRQSELKGPPLSVAFGADGAPTPAGLGFARKAGVDLEACERVGEGAGAHLVARRVEPGRAAAAVLAELVPSVILAIPYRKVMRWGDHDLEYPRPLQWIVALLGADIVDLAVGHLRSGRVTRGHRTLAGNREVTLDGPGSYLPALAAAGVMVDHDQRRRVIADGLAARLAAEQPHGHLLEDDDLLTEVVFLCEHPTPFLGAFGLEYAALPDEVVTTALKAHQRYFSVAGPDGRLLPCFAAVRDGGTDHLANVVAGNERVLRARLADALFYWQFDQKRTPDEHAARLGAVTWLEGFGSVGDKVARVEALVAWLWAAGLGNGGPVPPALVRAARICKFDLVTEMIRDGKEFTKLEGFIGARYAELAGEPAEVCRTIVRHYFPRSASSELPGDMSSSILSVADRLDTLAGCWLAGFVPTGAKDPYALRRHVLGIVRIMMDVKRSVDLDAAVAFALAQYDAVAPGADLAAARRQIGDFVQTRLGGYLGDAAGRDPAVVRAILPVRWRDPLAALAWTGALEGYRGRADFQALATGFKRCRNILKGAVLPDAERSGCFERWLAGGRGAAGEDFAALPEPAEQALQQQAAAAAPALRVAEAAGRHAEVFSLLSELGPAIDAYFEQVMVNTPDAALRAVRHAFVREIHGLFARYAEFGEVAPVDA